MRATTAFVLGASILTLGRAAHAAVDVQPPQLALSSIGSAKGLRNLPIKPWVKELVSVSTTGEAANADSVCASISADGRFVAFASYATNLAAGSASLPGVFLRDLQEGTTTRVDVDTTSGSSCPVISADGRFVAFTSHLGLDLQDDGLFDLLVWDRITGSFDDVLDRGLALEYALSGDGRFVALTHVFVPGSNQDRPPPVGLSIFDRESHTAKAVIMGDRNDLSGSPSLSSDGRFVAFESNRQDLVPDDTNGVADVFVYDSLAGSIERSSVGSTGGEADRASFGPAISADGRFVAFFSQATNLPGSSGTRAVFVRDRAAGTTVKVSLGIEEDFPTSPVDSVAISGDGTFVAYGSAAGVVYVRDRLRGNTTTLTAAPWPYPTPFEYNPHLSADGRFMVFQWPEYQGPGSGSQVVLWAHALPVLRSGVQRTPRGDLTLISKPIGVEQWAITANPADGSVTGNIFLTDGRDPMFVACIPTGDDGNPDPYEVAISFSCQGAGPCDGSTCPAADDWSLIGDVVLPGSFFLPERAGAEAGEALSKVDGVNARAQRPTDSSPLDTEAVAGGSGMQRTPDGSLTLISKRVGAEQWAITANTADGSVVGNIFFTDGRAPRFVSCERVGDDGNPDPHEVAITFRCDGANECVGSTCPAADDWKPIADRVVLPGSFFLPPR